jgi:hypothetical protein
MVAQTANLVWSFMIKAQSNMDMAKADRSTFRDAGLLESPLLRSTPLHERIELPLHTHMILDLGCIPFGVNEKSFDILLYSRRIRIVLSVWQRKESFFNVNAMRGAGTIRFKMSFSWQRGRNFTKQFNLRTTIQNAHDSAAGVPA